MFLPTRRRPSRWDECFARVSRSIYRIIARHSGGTVTATGFAVASYKSPDKLAFALATAEHVFRPLPANENVYWRVERLGILGDLQEVTTFTSNVAKLGNSPIRAHLQFDIGLLFMPPVNVPVEILPVINMENAVTPGCRVGWAGFPVFIEGKAGSPRPCYFEGVISSVIDRVQAEGRLFYLVDGHGGPGISGGPLWCWNDARGHLDVIGVCSQYLAPPASELNPSGVVVFESINPIIGYLSTSDDMKLDISQPARGAVETRLAFAPPKG